MTAVRVAELAGPKRFEIVDEEARAPAPGEVQVRVRAVGICGSDMHAYAEGGIGGVATTYPMVLGHEPAGEIAALGAGVTGFSIGDRVACEPGLCCHACDLCRRGRQNLCRSIRFMSLPGEPGFFRELVNVPAENAFVLPRGASFAEGALVEPLAVALHALALAGSVFGDGVVVFGAGPIGLLTVAALRLAGARRIWVAEPLPHRRALAIAMGADAAVAPEDAVASVLADTARAGIDLAIDCAAKGDTANACLAAARPGARIVYTGIPSEAQISLDVHTWRRKELALLQVRRSNQETAAARDLLGAHAKRFAPLLTHERPLARIAEAFRLVEAYADGVGKMTITL